MAEGPVSPPLRKGRSGGVLENCVRDPAHSPSKLEGVVEDRGRLSFSSTVDRPPTDGLPPTSWTPPNLGGELLWCSVLLSAFVWL